jgi:hypothetical protein
MCVLMCVLMCMQELGCSANEKSLERNLGEMQKTHFKHTNTRYNTEVIRQPQHIIIMVLSLDAFLS